MAEGAAPDAMTIDWSVRDRPGDGSDDSDGDDSDDSDRAEPAAKNRKREEGGGVCVMASAAIKFAGASRTARPFRSTWKALNRLRRVLCAWSRRSAPTTELLRHQKPLKPGEHRGGKVEAPSVED